MPVEPEEKKDAPPTETRCQGQGPPPGGGSEDASVSEERSQESSKSPPDSSSTSSSPDSDMDLSGRSRNKELHLRLSPESVISAKRCLWDVDRKEVDESLSRELKRIHQEEIKDKSIKWNFDFEKDVPMKGDLHWERAEEPPDFFKPKIYPSKRSSQNRASPYEKPPKRRSLEAVSSTAGSASSSDMTASSSTSSAPSLSPYLVSTSSSELSVLASKISSISSTTKDCEKPSPVQMASESSDIFEGKEKSSKDSLTLVVASSSSVGSSSSSDDRSSTTMPSSKRSRISQEQPISKTSAREDTPILSTCTSPFSVCSVVNVSSSDSSKASARKDSSGSSSSISNNNRNNNNGQNVSDIMDICSSSSTCQTSSRGSGTTSGIVPSQFYSVESDQPSEGGTTSSTSSDPPPQTKGKGKVPPGKPPKPSAPTSGESSSSHLLKYYR